MTNYLYDTLLSPNVDSNSCFLSSNGSEISFTQFCASAAQIAHTLTALGVTAGDRVVVQADKSPQMVMLYAASIQSGAVFLPLNTGYTHDELSYFITDSTPKIIVCDEKSKTQLSQLAEDVGARLLTLNADGTGSLTEMSLNQPKQFEPVPRGPDDLAALLYTSGTTGRSKGAMLTHKNLAANAQTLVETWQITDADTLIHALPIFHTHGLFVAMNTTLIAGAKVNFMRSFDLNAIVQALPTSTLMMGVPTFYTRLLTDDRLDKNLVRNMRLFISGSAPLLAETHDAFASRTDHRILERYGMTETNMNTSNPYNGDRIAGTVGLPLAGTEVRLTNPETGVTLPDGEIGVIEVRGPNVFKGYWNMPEKTAEELHADGFFITGDLGQFNDDGYLSIVGRQKDLIITGGYNVYPKEIEDVLNDVNGVEESAVFGAPHPDFGEMIIAAIVAQKGVDVDIKVVEQMMVEKLARFKHPRIFKIIPSLPRNTMGKVQKNILRKTHLNP
ncbi:MAG: malonyl-CoA/methylmalonyl-CoA synthetase [Candidatus Azotimanducaceae bacterium]|jgi:malonyl-CoA/methylmalonyl-CoA synthetase